MFGLYFLYNMYYTHNFGLRNAKLASIAYCDPVNILNETNPFYEENKIKPVLLGGGNTRYVMFSDEIQNAVVFSFRGSSNVENWISDIDAVKINPYVDKNIQVHRGFYNDYMVIRDELYSLFPLKNNIIILTGHSYGGAIATLFSYDLTLRNISSVLITFGKPRTGNSYFSSNIKNHYRITHKEDIVPHLPYEWMGFQHSNTEIWYETDNIYKVCPDTESLNCSNSCSFFQCTSVDDHLSYLGVKMGSDACF